MTTITLPIDPKHFWAIVALAGFVLAVAVVYAAMPRTEGKHSDPLDRLKDILGLAQFGDGLFLLLALMWSGLFLALFGGLLLMLWELIWFAVPQNPSAEASARFALLRLAAMTATLGAVVALPFTLIRVRLTRDSNKTADESLFNDKINAATEDLHAMRQRWDGEQNIWEDDITRRNAAIDRLEGLANERPDTAPRISRLLSVYVRELTREVPSEIPPEDVATKDLRTWAQGPTVKRSDMENAVQVLGRLKQIGDIDPDSITIDLRGANLKSFDLSGLQLSKALLSEAQMQGAHLNGAHMQEANLNGAHMQKASLNGAHMQGADLRKTQMQEADLFEAQMQRAHLNEAQMQEANLNGAHMQKANLNGAHMQKAHLNGAQMQKANLNGAHMQKAHLNGAQMQKANLFAAQVQGAHFSGAQMQRANLFQAQMQGANLNGAHMQKAHLNGAQMQKANLFAAQVQGANLNGAHMQKADLRSAQLQGAVLFQAQMQGANLSGAAYDETNILSRANFSASLLSSVDFANVGISREQLNSGFGTSRTVLPDGSGPENPNWPAHWPTLRMTSIEARNEWEKWQTDPDNYTPPTAP
ncbi:putative low-complexity protein [Phaeobacter piscinae]|uniref:Low-complexity protein n=2 Tax=Phaeobacter piscinae TaxID=1580596 RepID=A0AAN1GR94_9RHOB|nr:putative low-complexity protein [Phaeobacter piscinae]